MELPLSTYMCFWILIVIVLSVLHFTTRDWKHDYHYIEFDQVPRYMYVIWALMGYCLFTLAVVTYRIISLANGN